MGIRILLVEDQKILREGLRALLVTQPELEVIGEADDRHAVLELARELSPDVVLMGIQQSELEGIEIMRCIASEMPRIKVIALASNRGSRCVTDMFRAGVSGYLLTDCTLNELHQAIRAVTNDQKYLCTKMSQLVVDGFLNHLSASTPSKVHILSSREHEVVRCLAEGKTTTEVAACLQLSPKTVDKHRQNIMNKLNIHKSTQLIRYGILEGLIHAGNGRNLP
jgi:two-component system, NarL family, response regulator NreC